MKTFNKDFLIEKGIPKKGDDILELSAPQKGDVDPVTGEKQTAKVIHSSLSLPAGYTCPYATECRARTVKHTKYKTFYVGKVVDGPLCKFRCFAASNEAIYGDAREMRNRNMEKLTGVHPDKVFGDITDSNPLRINDLDMDEFDKELKGDESKFGDLISDVTSTIHDKDTIKDYIIKTIASNKNYIITTGPKYNDKGVIRIHVSGDFFSQAYFDAFMEAAELYKDDIIFYAYTKSIPYWVKAKASGIIPKNFKLNGSYGGSKDDLIRENEFKFARVCFTKDEANNYPYVDAEKTTLLTDSRGNPVQGWWINENGIRTMIENGLPICEEDDFPAYEDNGSPFALLLHGTQPAGSDAAAKISKIKSEGKDDTTTARLTFLINKFPELDEIDVQIVLIIYMMYYNIKKKRVVEKGGDARKKEIMAVNEIAKFLIKENLVTKHDSVPMASAKFNTLKTTYDIKNWAETEFTNHKGVK